MRNRNSGKKLGRKTAHRIMMFRNMVKSFLNKERIRTLCKRESLHARRRALAFIKDPLVVSKLFSTLAPRFAQRNGGYTRIIRLGWRDGDGAQMAILELLGSEYKGEKAGETKGEKKAKKKAGKGEAPAAP